MKRLVTMLLALFVIVAALVFLIKHNEKKQSENPPADGPEIFGEVFKPHIAAEEERFLLIRENDYLNLYHIGEKKALKKSERINIGLFPEGDIKRLSSGIEYPTPEEAYAAMENYIG